ncbi:MAG: toll/interleukin-1 receptor domain-containing protein [Planctomycetes bacterium]|nr:toll/interleukin-1 receptor domain-containing protein [Planctomycetota bacterium]
MLESPKLAVSLRGSPSVGRDFLDAFEASDFPGLDHERLLAAADTIALSERSKSDHIVLKVSYVIIDAATTPNRVAVFRRMPRPESAGKGKKKGHANKIGNSVVLSAGIENDLSLRRRDKGWLLNPYYPLSHKLGAYLGEIELPLLPNETGDTLQRYSLFVFRRDRTRHYGFYVHVGVLNHPNSFPVTPTALIGSSEDLFEGFFPLDTARSRQVPPAMAVDHCVLALLAGERPSIPGVFWRSMVAPEHFASRVVQASTVERVPRDATRHSGQTLKDVFVSYASEDRDAIVRPLCDALENAGISVWFDERSAVPGATVNETVSDGLLLSRFAVVVVTPNLLSRSRTAWVHREIDAIAERETRLARNMLIPLREGVSDHDVGSLPMLASRSAVQWRDGIDAVVAAVRRVVRA